MPKRSLEKRLWAKVNKDGPVPEHRPDLGPCWLWQGGTTLQGQGRISVGGRDGHQVLVYRLTYEWENGPIPEGLEPDHLCRNPACVRPSHLEPVTHRENMLRSKTFVAAKAAQTHCVHGHEFTDANIYRHPQRGTRHCRQCGLDHSAAQTAARRQAKEHG